MSSIIDYTDRTTCVLFGDGAGAVVRRAVDGRANSASSISSTRSMAAAVRRSACRPAAAASRLARDGRRSGCTYVKQDGAGGFQVRGAQHRGDLPSGCSNATASPRRHRSVRLAPGQSPHHPVGRRAARHAAGEGRHQHRSVRQHHSGDDSAGAERCRGGRPLEERRPRAADVGRRRVHRRRDTAALGFLKKLRQADLKVRPTFRS